MKWLLVSLVWVTPAFAQTDSISIPTGLPLSGGALTGTFNLPAGTLGAPVLTFSGDTTSGFYRPLASALSIGPSEGDLINLKVDGINVCVHWLTELGFVTSTSGSELVGVGSACDIPYIRTAINEIQSNFNVTGVQNLQDKSNTYSQQLTGNTITIMGASDVATIEPAQYATAEYVISIPNQAADLPTAQTMAKTARIENPGRPIVILLPSGITRLTEPIELTSSDSGSTQAPLIIRGQPDGSSSILGSIPLPNDGIDGNGNSVANLTTHGISIGSGIIVRTWADTNNSGNFELFQGDQRLRLARWPSAGQGFSLDWHYVHGGNDGVTNLTATIPGHGVTNWTSEENLWLGCTCSYPWVWETKPISTISGPSTIVTRPFLHNGYPFVDGMGFFIFNSVHELNVGTLGQYVYLTSGNQFLYRPYPNGLQVELARTSRLIHVNGAHDVIIEKVSLEKSLGAAVVFDSSDRITIRDSFVGHTSGEGIEINNGTYDTILRCVVADTSNTGILITAGTRSTLTPANHAVKDSIIVDNGIDSLMDEPAISLRGVGLTVSGSYLGRNSQALLTLFGNDISISDSEMVNGVLLSSDAGELSQYDITNRGFAFDYNFFHDAGRSGLTTKTTGIYLDFNGSGAKITNNLFTQMVRQILIHGGRDNYISGNMFMYPYTVVEDGTPGAIYFGDLPYTPSELAAVPYTNALWTSRFPTLANVLSNSPNLPLGNVVQDNIMAGTAPIIGFGNAGDMAYLTDQGTTSSGFTQSQVALFEDPIANAAAIAAFPGALGVAGAAATARRVKLGNLLYASRAGALSGGYPPLPTIPTWNSGTAQASALQLWFDASDANTLIQSGGSVSKWIDKSGNGNNAIPATSSAEPTIQTTQNGLNTLRFNGASSQKLILKTPINVEAAYTIIGVVRRGYSMNSTAYVSSTPQATTTYNEVATDMTLGGPYRIFFNGADVNSGNSTRDGSATFNQIGNGDTLYMNGEIGEFLVYNSILTTAQRQSLEAYLKAKWGP